MTEEEIRLIVRDEIRRAGLSHHNGPTGDESCFMAIAWSLDPQFNAMSGDRPGGLLERYKNAAQTLFGAGPAPLTDEAQARMA